MNPSDFKDKLNAEMPKDNYLPADQAGIIKIDDIVSVAKEGREYIDKADPTKKYTQFRVVLTMKSRQEKISCPTSAMDQLIELMVKNNVVAFQVLKSGTGLATKYSVSPILG
jgi:hypothetical protein